jgi:ribosomal protein L37AE/L43A
MILTILEVIATVLSMAGAILVAYNTDKARHYGFGIWIISNVFWIAYGLMGMTYGVVITFGTYMVCNIIATRRNGHEYMPAVCPICKKDTLLYVKKGTTWTCPRCGAMVDYE